MPRYVGIDPGMDGAIVVVDDKLRLIEAHLMPTCERRLQSGKKKRDYAISEIVDMAKGWRRMTRVALEAAWARPGEGAIASFSLGASIYVWRTALTAVGIDHYIVSPNSWTSVMRKVPGKQGSIETVKMRLPELDLKPGKKRKEHTGLADAGCIALFCAEHVDHEN